MRGSVRRVRLSYVKGNLIMDRRLSWAVCGLVMIGVLAGTRLWAKPLFFGAKPKPVEWQHNLPAAHKIAVQSNRPILVVFGAPWCGYCRKLETETLGDAALVKIVNTDFVPVHLDYEKDRRIFDLLEVKSLPTCIALSTQADILATMVGYMDKAELRKKLDAALQADRDLRAAR